MRSRWTRQGGIIGVGLLIALVASLAAPGQSHAVPTLQLDILGGHYDTTTHTIIAPGDQFTLYALMTPDPHTSAQTQLGETYYISAALVPQTGPPGAALGSFSFNGTPVNVTHDMVYGTPPIELNGSATPDQFDLNQFADGGIFQTYFSEFAFHFPSTNRAFQYDSALTPGVGPTPVPPGYPFGVTYFAAFNVDTRGLAGGYALHFDLYNEIVHTPCVDPVGPQTPGNFPCDVDVRKVADNAHDAQTPTRRVPEAHTLLLLGSGLVLAGLRLSRRGGRH